MRFTSQAPSQPSVGRICIRGEEIRDRSSAESWQNRTQKLGDVRLQGRFFPFTRVKRREVDCLGAHYQVNLAGFPAQ
jgi:hypothetical protein